MKAPLSQTLFLTEDGSALPVTVGTAVTIPPIVIGIAPSFDGRPSVQSDGTPQVGEQLLGIDAAVLNLGSAILRRAWLLGPTVIVEGASFTPDDDLTYTFRNQLVVAGVVVATVSVDVTVSAAPPAIAFTRRPAITSAAPYTVDRVVTLDLGEIDGDRIGQAEMVDANGQPVAEVTTTTFRLTAPGQIALRVHAAGDSTIFATSDPITVVAAAASTRSAPLLRFPEGRAAGTNPVLIEFSSTDDTIDKNNDRLEYEYTAAGAPGSGSIELLGVQTTGEDYFAVTGLDDLAAGAFRFRARFAGPDGAPSPWSGWLEDVLSAKALPPASTLWSVAAERRSFRATLSTDRRTAMIQETGAMVGIMCDTPRLDRRYVELTWIKAGSQLEIGIMDESRIPLGEYEAEWANGSDLFCIYRSLGITNDGAPVFPDNAAFALGDKLRMDIDPIVSAGARTGTRVRFAKNGRQSAWFASKILRPVFWCGSLGDSHCRLNTGQEAPAYPPAEADIIRWN